MFGEVFTLLALAIIAIVYYLSKRKFNYWKDRNVPYLEPIPILGNYGPFIFQKKYSGKMVQRICRKLPNKPYFGVFYGTEPTLMVQDPDIIKTVMTKDFYYFSSREISKYTYKEIISQSLFDTYGDRWKVLRQNMTPLFSSSKLKNMFYLIEHCSHVFEDMLDKELKVDNVQAVRPLIARFTMDCIGTCAFGVETKTMAQDSEENVFVKMGNEIFLESYWRGFTQVIRSIWPALFYGLGGRSYPEEVDVFFSNLLTGVFAERDYKPTNRKDFVDLILNWKTANCITGDSMDNLKSDGKKVSLEVDDEILVAQCTIFFAAGFETSSTTLQYTLFELAKNTEAQNRVIEEIDEYLLRHKNKLGYECITELPYTEACFDEALRLYPVLGMLTREVFEDYTLPCGAAIEKGIRVHIPVYHLHHNPDFFPEPEVFRPERFYGEEKRNIIPYTYMPFGEGPRLCIGMRFAKMQMFAGIVTLLKKYRVELAAGTPRALEFTPTTIVTQPKQLIKLKFIEREGWQQRLFNK
ncbi:cytochrome P450 6B5-like isoform X1 [Plodia interpunctella]|uniref:cytochrome P450 6B5-like isoform X1 n=1 Tax=Plodia interpunctella TaxID=58824 RepID=UPI0023674B7A|nr:cytochrome P450 6B5-like isoform X1 [Plodia interpunctella]